METKRAAQLIVKVATPRWGRQRFWAKANLAEAHCFEKQHRTGADGTAQLSEDLGRRKVLGTEQCPAVREHLATLAVGKQSEVTDADQALRQNVNQEPAEKLICRHGEGRTIMNIRKLTIAIALFTALIAANLATATPQTLSGVITDDMCSKKHTMMPGKPDSECIRACVKAGSKYALLVGDKVYALKGDTKQLDQLAGKKVKVSGDVTGNTVALMAIGEAK